MGLRLPSAPIETSLTPLLVMKSKALLTLLILWTLILPRSGLGSRSPADVHKHIHWNRYPRRQKSPMFAQDLFRIDSGEIRLRTFPSAKTREDLPEMTSSRSMSFSPSLKSSSMFSICVPAFLRWELHHAVNVCTKAQKHHKNSEYFESQQCLSDFCHNKSHFE